ncbi:MAG: metallophosphoesterase [Actinomycetota bacterium]|nr:metallophosphoesterase [Actinomycetota bacterium]
MAPFVIAQISDIHCGSAYFDPLLLAQAVDEIRDLAPDLVVVAGDLTQEGYASEFQTARDALRPLQEELTTLVVPGNHDSKNVGYLHFGDAFGKGEAGAKFDRTLHLSRAGSPGRISVVAIDSSKPDLNEGEVGRERYEWIVEQYSYPADYRIFVLHHHLVPVPGTGRERNIVWDAGDVLGLLDDARVNLVLAGHRHVPHVWLVGDMLVVNSGTVSSFRLRGYTRPSYNVLHVSEEEVIVTLVYPGAGERRAAHFDRSARRLEREPELAGMFSKAAWAW